jgi:hypothetical protein
MVKKVINALRYVYISDPMRIDISEVMEDDERRFNQLDMSKYGTRMESGFLIGVYSVYNHSFHKKEENDLRLRFLNKSKMIDSWVYLEHSVLDSFNEVIMREHILEKTKSIILKIGTLSQKKYTFDAAACLRDVEELLSKTAPPRELDFDAPLVSLAEIERCRYFYTPKQMERFLERRMLQIKHGLISEDY